MNFTVMILGMAAITLATRASFFVLGHRIVFPRLAREALDYVPVVVLTAIVVPLVLAPHGGGLEISWRNPQLVAAVAAVGVSAAARRQFLTIVTALAAFFAWQFGVLG